ncbi:MAG: lipoprotein-releasing system ATP-binding protein LolD, partial [Flavobacteriaceae bacterium]|nr:lipoprotein-releasing system ATP-binding protein LolD [Flavobacteriaceae bacterium]
QILGTLDKPESDIPYELSINNTVIKGLKDKEISAFRNQHIGFIFQFHQLLPELTAKENILLPSMIGKFDSSKSHDNLNKLSSILDINKILDKKPEFLSGGEKQRVAVARALINNPSLLLADEPTGNLDSDNAKKIQELFKKINKELGVTIVLVTHNEKFSKIARKCLVLKDGKWSK